jgi:molybdate/tungstate transport system ATP-binding protein
VLELTGLAVSYADFDFGPVDLAVDGEVLAVLGPSGSGKTTLLSLVAGIVRPDSGSVVLNGRSLVGRPLEARRTGVVFQDGALFPHMTARENVNYAATSRGRVDDLAAVLEIRDVLDRRPAALSGGERQRVALARTLAADPDALLLDEPLSSLDAPIRRRLRDELHDLFSALEIPVVYVTHDQRAATVLGDRLAVLHDGRVAQVGTPAAVLDRPETAHVARFTGSENVFRARVTRRDGDRIELRVGTVTLDTESRCGSDIGTTVSACVRPSQVRVRDRDGDATPSENVVPGTVRRVLNEGDDYRVSVTVDGADLVVTALSRPSAVGRLRIGSGSPVGLSIPPSAIHVLDADDE